MKKVYCSPHIGIWKGMLNLKHTLLFTPSDWNIAGTYHHSSQQKVSITGKGSVHHGEHYWTSQIQVEFDLNPPTTLQVDFRIRPFQHTATTWEAKNTIFGDLYGKFIIMGNYIQSIYETLDLKYSGVELYHKIDETTYHNQGVLLKGNRKISSWDLKCVQCEKSNHITSHQKTQCL